MPVERVITVEYLQPSMAKELLYKFPDNSVFGFDYSQSGIWSPPIPRRFPALVESNSQESQVGRRQKEKKRTKVKGKKIAKRKRKSNVKNHLASDGSKLVLNKTDLPTPHQGWAKVLRAATMRLKKAD